MPRALILKHVPFEGPAAIGDWLASEGFETRTLLLSEPHTLPALDEIDWLIVMGGPMGANDEATCPWMAAEKRLIRDAIDNGRTVIGICLGAQLIASVLGAPVTRNPAPEIGWFPIQPTVDCPQEISLLFRDMPKVLHWHGDTFALPDGARHLFASEACDNQGYLYADRVLGLQCHLECDADTLAGLCYHCADELTPDTWVQDAETLQSVSDIALASLHERLFALLALLPRGRAA